MMFKTRPTLIALALLTSMTASAADTASAPVVQDTPAQSAAASAPVVQDTPAQTAAASAPVVQDTPAQTAAASAPVVQDTPTQSAAASAPVVQDTPAQPAAASVLNSPEQIGKIVEDYLVAHPEKVGEVVGAYLAEHPEFLVAAGENLHQRQQQAQQEAMVQLAIQHQDELLSKNTPSVGPEDAKVAVVMFFDYQCAYCSRMAPVVEALMKANPQVRFVFKELPIFAQRWPVSGLAARTGLKIWQEKGGDAYITYHNGLYATGHNEGALTPEDVHQAAAPYLRASQLKALKNSPADSVEAKTLAEISALAQTMHFSGTPAFVVMPQAEGPEAKRVTVLPGATEQTTLQTAIAKATGE